MSAQAINVEGIGKTYRIGLEEESYPTFRQAIVGAITSPIRRFKQLGEKGTERDTFWALKDISFEVQRGEVVGIIGRNGAGKSTLLKILSRITEPTEGRARLRGRVASLLEVGTGFHPELTGRENIFLNGGILGMRKAEIRRKFDAIVAFAEVEKFLDTQVKRYSSGMYVRLAFAVAAHLEPEILIIDEVLAVGDAQFQRKCLGKMQEAAMGQGRTVLFVSHNMPAVRSLCHSCCLIEGGRLTLRGSAEDCVQRYLTADMGDELKATVKLPVKGDPRIRMESATLYCNGEKSAYLQMGDELDVEIEFTSDPPVQHPRIGIVILSTDGEKLINTNNRYLPSDDFAAPVSAGRLRLRLGRVPLVGGKYFVSFWLGDLVHDTHIAENAMVFEVIERDVWGQGRVPPKGAARMWWPATFEIEESVQGMQA